MFAYFVIPCLHGRRGALKIRGVANCMPESLMFWPNELFALLSWSRFGENIVFSEEIARTK